jgi:uncharacterized protein (TIGR02996 family)
MPEITARMAENPYASSCMNEEAAFLRAICENPDDDTPRLVFADWLTEQGGAVNTAWANGIRAQIWLAQGATDEALQFQTCVFDSPFGQEKLRERLMSPSDSEQNLRVSGWERGFPCDLMGIFSEIRDVWPGLAFRIPIRKLYSHQMTATDAAEFITWPALTTLRELSCTGPWHGAQGNLIPLVASCAGLRNLKTLHLYNVIFTDSTLAALLTSPHLAGLQELRLGYEGSATTVSDAVRSQLTARFGEDVFDDAIPF